jgi:hypothetical protein
MVTFMGDVSLWTAGCRNARGRQSGVVSERCAGAAERNAERDCGGVGVASIRPVWARRKARARNSGVASGHASAAGFAPVDVDRTYRDLWLTSAFSAHGMWV